MNHSRTKKLSERSREYRKLRLILPIRLRFLKFIVVEMGSENRGWFGFVVERVLAKEVCFEEGDASGKALNITFPIYWVHLNEC